LTTATLWRSSSPTWGRSDAWIEPAQGLWLDPVWSPRPRGDDDFPDGKAPSIPEEGEPRYRFITAAPTAPTAPTVTPSRSSERGQPDVSAVLHAGPADHANGMVSLESPGSGLLTSAPRPVMFRPRVSRTVLPSGWIVAATDTRPVTRCDPKLACNPEYVRTPLAQLRRPQARSGPAARSPVRLSTRTEGVSWGQTRRSQAQTGP